MPVPKMHHDEVSITADLIQQLLHDQFPEWANLDLQLIRPEGTDNAMYKLGADKVVRLPRMTNAALTLEKESLWLPQLAPQLPITIPTILGIGKATEDYPFPWLVMKYLDGRNPEDATLDHQQAALDLGHFITALQKTDTKKAPTCRRGQPLIERDQETREAISQLSDLYDIDLLTKLWEKALTTPEWSHPPVWIHGDLHAGNMLAQHGKITAIVDFGSAGIGDPAADLMLAWTLLTRETREVFRSILKPDDDTWERGRGWALTLGTVAYPYYKETNPEFAKIAKRAIDEVLADHDL